MIFEIDNLNPKFLKAWADLVSKSKMLIMNVLMMTLTKNQKFPKFAPKKEMCSNFHKISQFEQIDYADYELELMVVTQNYRFGKIWSQY